MDSFLESAGEHLLYVVIGVVFIVGMTLKTITAIVTSNTRERSRREIAAYIAEGSIDPAQGERLIKADVGTKPCQL